MGCTIGAGCTVLLAALVGQVRNAEAAGVVGVSHGRVDVATPPNVPANNSWSYGLGMPIQLDATTGGLLVNIRRNGTPYGDFEVGTDLIKFTSLDGISANDAIPISRPTNEPNPWTGVPSTTSKYPLVGGFVPLGGKFANGKAHPYGGTGFGICEVGFYPSDYSQPLPPPNQLGYHLELQQFAYDGSRFTASRPIRVSSLPIANTPWKITATGLSSAVPDGNDLLFAVTCSNADSAGIIGVARFQYGANGWQPTSFAPVTNAGQAWYEPSLIRDVDGSLLFSGRNDGGNPITVWGSPNGNAWNRLINVDAARANCTPVVLNQAADGSPFLVTTMAASVNRNVLDLVPLNSDRTGLDATITVRNGPAEFDPTASYAVDHGVGNLIRLADGQWHSLLTYRVIAPPASPFTGCYIEEVFSSGEPRPMGLVFMPEPASGLLTLFAAASIMGFLVLNRRNSRCNREERKL
jgi:hypothetical protein